MRRLFKLVILLSFALAGVTGTLLVQRACAPEQIAFVPSPDGQWIFIVDRSGDSSREPACRTFRICYLDQESGAADRLTDGLVYVQHEYESAGIDMSQMKTYWRGTTAVADFGETRLERDALEDHWTLIWPQAIAASQPATQPASTLENPR